MWAWPCYFFHVFFFPLVVVWFLLGLFRRERAAHTVGLGPYFIYGKIKEDNCGFMVVWHLWKIKEDIYGKINEEVCMV